MTRVVVADDQAVVREGLVLLLGLLPGIEVVGSAADGEAALRLVERERPDVVLMDLRMPRMDGVEATRSIRAAYPGTQVVVLTTYSDDESVFAALRAGARGYLTKDADSDEIARAIATVVRGDAQLDPTVQRRLLDAMPPSATAPSPPLPPADERPSRRRHDPAPASADPGNLAAGPRAAEAAGGADVEPDQERADRAREGERGGEQDRGPGPESGAGLPDGLTRREGEVLRLIADGLSNAEIAARLYISEATVKTHINNLFAKARLRDRAQAVTYAYRHGLARPS
ncbi:response regulator transcription factor [Actinomadura luzonensis]|uniref:response regulator transcription factor n=1 Tax=Actinomadura luzonensis TaxID=2805427 RepID=UPI002676303C|nr:response regulator transcription factor [Actinomadura luzonensis]